MASVIQILNFNAISLTGKRVNVDIFEDDTLQNIAKRVIDAFDRALSIEDLVCHNMGWKSGSDRKALKAAIESAKLKLETEGPHLRTGWDPKTLTIAYKNDLTSNKLSFKGTVNQDGIYDTLASLKKKTLWVIPSLASIP